MTLINLMHLVLKSFKSVISVVIAVFLLGLPADNYGGVLLKCIDKSGKETFSDYPLENQTCDVIESLETSTERKTDRTGTANPAAKENTTEIIIRENGVFVPVTIIYDNREVKVTLLLDTGASITTIFNQAVEGLYMNLHNAQKAQGTVVGGGKIDARRIMVNNLIVGPNTFNNWHVFVVSSPETDAAYDGLLGMDVLSRMSYKIDLQKKVIIWE